MATNSRRLSGPVGEEARTLGVHPNTIIRRRRQARKEATTPTTGLGKLRCHACGEPVAHHTLTTICYR